MALPLRKRDCGPRKDSLNGEQHNLTAQVDPSHARATRSVTGEILFDTHDHKRLIIIRLGALGEGLDVLADGVDDVRRWQRTCACQG
jgi:hypothetical protein